MNIEAYNLDSLRKLVRVLQAENKEFRELLEKAEIPYSSSEVFVDTPVRKEELEESLGKCKDAGIAYEIEDQRERTSDSCFFSGSVTDATEFVCAAVTKL